MKNNIAFFQHKRNRKLSEIAENVNTSKENLRMIKNHDRIPGVDLAIRIADYLECSVKDLWVFPIAILLFGIISFYYLGDMQINNIKEGKLIHVSEEFFFKDINKNECVFIQMPTK